MDGARQCAEALDCGARAALFSDQAAAHEGFGQDQRDRQRQQVRVGAAMYGHGGASVREDFSRRLVETAAGFRHDPSQQFDVGRTDTESAASAANGPATANSLLSRSCSSAPVLRISAAEYLPRGSEADSPWNSASLVALNGTSKRRPAPVTRQMRLSTALESAFSASNLMPPSLSLVIRRSNEPASPWRIAQVTTWDQNSA